MLLTWRTESASSSKVSNSVHIDILCCVSWERPQTYTTRPPPPAFLTALRYFDPPEHSTAQQDDGISIFVVFTEVIKGEGDWSDPGAVTAQAKRNNIQGTARPGGDATRHSPVDAQDNLLPLRQGLLCQLKLHGLRAHGVQNKVMVSGDHGVREETRGRRQRNNERRPCGTCRA